MIRKESFIPVTVLSLTLLLLSCEKFPPPDSPVEMECEDELQVHNNILNNSNVEDESNSLSYWKWNGYVNYTSSWSSDYAFSCSHSLKIGLGSIVDSSFFSYWAQTISSNIPIGKELTLKAWIKVENITDQGIAIAIRGDNADPTSIGAEVFSTTQGKTEIKGTKDWSKYSVVLSDVPDDISTIQVYLIHLSGGTTGTVYFDDIYPFIPRIIGC